MENSNRALVTRKHRSVPVVVRRRLRILRADNLEGRRGCCATGRVG